MGYKDYKLHKYHLDKYRIDLPISSKERKMKVLQKIQCYQNFKKNRNRLCIKDKRKKFF